MAEVPDVMAGDRARRIRAHPDEPERVVDPTDPRYGTPEREQTRSAPAREDPTDPRPGHLAA